jgi:hypothetical protein
MILSKGIILPVHIVKIRIKNAHSKRGNVYLNKLIYICFNCDKKTTFDRMCRDFNEQVDPDKS